MRQNLSNQFSEAVSGTRIPPDTCSSPLGILLVLLYKCIRKHIHFLYFCASHKYFSNDRDGIITTQELFEAIRTSKDAPTEDKARKICELLDMDKDGALDLDELKKVRPKDLQCYTLDMRWFPLPFVQLLWIIYQIQPSAYHLSIQLL